jgi:hypothetical protein
MSSSALWSSSELNSTMSSICSSLIPILYKIVSNLRSVLTTSFTGSLSSSAYTLGYLTCLFSYFLGIFLKDLSTSDKDFYCSTCTFGLASVFLLVERTGSCKVLLSLRSKLHGSSTSPKIYSTSSPGSIISTDSSS